MRMGAQALAWTHVHARTDTHVHTHTRTRAHTHAHTHTCRHGGLGLTQEGSFTWQGPSRARDLERAPAAAGGAASGPEGEEAASAGLFRWLARAMLARQAWVWAVVSGCRPWAGGGKWDHAWGCMAHSCPACVPAPSALSSSSSFLHLTLAWCAHTEDGERHLPPYPHRPGAPSAPSLPLSWACCCSWPSSGCRVLLSSWQAHGPPSSKSPAALHAHSLHARWVPPSAPPLLSQPLANAFMTLCPVGVPTLALLAAQQQL